MDKKTTETKGYKLLGYGLLVSVAATAVWVTTAGATAARADEPEDRCPLVAIADLGDGDAGFLSQRVARQARPFLGVELTGLTPELRRHFGVGDDAGVMVSKVVDDSAAKHAGLEVGDIITGLDDVKIDSAWKLTHAVRDRRSNDVVAIEYWRDGRPSTTPVTLGEKATCSVDVSGLIGNLDGLANLGHLEALEGLGDLDFQLPFARLEQLKIDDEALEEVMESLRAIDWEEHLQKIEALREENFEEQMKRLQERMEMLEKRLETEGASYDVKVRQRLQDVERSHQQRVEAQARARQDLARARIEARAARTAAAVAKDQAIRVETQRVHVLRAEGREAEARARALAEAARRVEEERAREHDETGEGGPI